MSRLLNLYVDLLRRFHYLFIFAWLAIAVTSAFFVMDFISHTTVGFDAPSGTRAYVASQRHRELFPTHQEQSDVSVFADVADGVLGRGGATAVCVKRVNPTNVATSVTQIPSVRQFVDAISARITHFMATAQVASYYQLTAIGATDVAAGLLSNTSSMLMVPVVLPVQFSSPAARHFATKLLAANVELAESVLRNASLNTDAAGGAPSFFTEDAAYAACVSRHLASGATGVAIMEGAMVSQSKKDLAKMDAIVIPIALLVMALTVQSLRLLILPILSIGLSLCVSFALMYPVAVHVPVVSAAPSLMMSLCIAMGIDYNLFLLSRFVEEVRAGHRGAAAVANTLRTAGHTVFISGLSLVISFVALVFFPTALLRSFGMGCSLSIIIAMLISLNLTPAILICFFDQMAPAAYPLALPGCLPQWRVFEYLGFYLGSVPPGGRLGGQVPSLEAEDSTYSRRGSQTAFAADNNNNMFGHPRESGVIASVDGFDPTINPNPSFIGHSGDSSSRDHSSPNFSQTIGKERVAQYGDHGDSVFYRLAPLLRWPWNAASVLLLTGVVAFIGQYTLQLRTTDEMTAFLQRGGSQRDDFVTIKQHFGEGVVFPYQFMFVMSAGSAHNAKHRYQSVLGNASTVRQVQTIARAISNSTGSALSAFRSPFFIGDRAATFADIRGCSDAATAWTPACNKNVLVMMSNATISPSGDAVTVEFVSNIDPTGNDGHDFYNLLLGLVQLRPGDYCHAAAPPSAADTWAVPTCATPQHAYAEIEVYVLGVGPASMDTIAAVYAHFPIIAAAACTAVMVMVGIAFRSVVVPLRCIISIAFTEAFVFGATTLVYQKGIFDFMRDPAVSGAGAISWLSPVVAFCVVIGVALDYDIFLLTRVTEYIAHEGVSTAEGTLLGLCATGRIITAAGLSMAIAFVGLMLTGMRLVNELGFMLTIAVAFDALVVRTLLVPSVMSLLGKWHWWPADIESSSFSHIFQPSDSISARASVARTDIDYGTGGGAGGGVGDTGAIGGGRLPVTSAYAKLDAVAGRVNNHSARVQSRLEQQQQRQRLQHLLRE